MLLGARGNHFSTKKGAKMVKISCSTKLVKRPAGHIYYDFTAEIYTLVQRSCTRVYFSSKVIVKTRSISLAKAK